MADRSSIMTWVLVFLVVAQLSTFYLFYQFDQDTTNSFSVLRSDMSASNNQLSTEIESVSKELDSEVASINTDIASTKTELETKTGALEEQITSSQETLGRELQELEQNQAQTAADLERSIDNLQLSNKDFTDIIEKALPSVVSVLAASSDRTVKSSGSGVFVEETIILTNEHVVGDYPLIAVVITFFIFLFFWQTLIILSSYRETTKASTSSFEIS